MSLIARLDNLKVYFYDQGDKRFIRAVEDVSFSVDEGSVLGIVGESGCGKTVTALSMMGLIDSEPGMIGGDFFFKPKQKDRAVIEQALLWGEKTCNGYRKNGLLNLFYRLERFVQFEHNPFTIIKDTEKWLRKQNRIMEHVRGKNISMVFQNPRQSLNPFIPVGDQLTSTIARFSKDKTKNEAHERGVELLDSVRLFHPQLIMTMYPNSLSVGMAKRVILAIALASNPKLLIADEPTTGLDTTNKFRIIDLLQNLMSRMSLTLILISHDIGVVQVVATDIVVMYGGMIVEIGRKRDIISTKKGMKHPYTEALVSSVPTDSDIKRGKRLKVISGSVPNNKRRLIGCPFVSRCPYAVGKIRRRCVSECPDLVEGESAHLIRCYLYYPGRE